MIRPYHLSDKQKTGRQDVNKVLTIGELGPHSWLSLPSASSGICYMA